MKGHTLAWPRISMARAISRSRSPHKTFGIACQNMCGIWRNQSASLPRSPFITCPSSLENMSLFCCREKEETKHLLVTKATEISHGSKKSRSGRVQWRGSAEPSHVMLSILTPVLVSTAPCYGWICLTIITVIAQDLTSFLTILQAGSTAPTLEPIWRHRRREDFP